MKVDSVLVIGLGEIGAPLLEIVKGVYHAEGLDIEAKELQDSFDILHICIPYTEEFVRTTIDYINRFNPKLTIIESTVLPFTTDKIHRETETAICHSPVRGRKEDGFKWAYLNYTKFIGPVEAEYGRMAEEYYHSLGFKTYTCSSPLETEFMKILNTTYYGLMIAWFQEIHRICKKFNLKEEEITRFLKTNQKESAGRHQRPVFYPGIIKGHCVIPNAKMLEELYQSPFVKVILDSNEKWKVETHLEKVKH